MSIIDDLQAKYDLQVLAKKKVKSGLRAEELRERLDPESAIIGLLALGEEAKTCEMVDLPRLQFRATILTTILRKCMPDLKSLEVKERQSNFMKLVIDMDGAIAHDDSTSTSGNGSDS